MAVHENRNNTLDVMKLVASYMVIFIHVLFPGKMGVAADALGRFAVPLFFFVSGYYAYGASPETIRARTVRLVRLSLFAFLFYIAYDGLRMLLYLEFEQFIQFLTGWMNLKIFLKLVVFNTPVYNFHLWYLLACVYVYGLYYAAVKFAVPEKWIFTLSGLALLVHLFLGEFLSIFHIVVPISLVRNFALMGIPFFGFGLLARKYKCKIEGVSNWAIAAAMAIGMLESLLSVFLFGKNELYLGSVLVLAALVAIFIKYPNVHYPSWLLSLTGCSTYIYIFHPILPGILGLVYGVLGIHFYESVAVQMVHPIIVCILATVLAVWLGKLTQKKQVIAAGKR